MIKKIAFLLTLISASTAFAAVPHIISKDAPMDANSITFKSVDDAWRKEGVFPIKDHIGQMQVGLTKQELYTAFGKPHFSEGMFAVRQWDYIFKFKVADEIKVCQYQIHFDNDYKVANTFWDKSECSIYAGIPSEMSVIKNDQMQIEKVKEVETKVGEEVKLNESISIID